MASFLEDIFGAAKEGLQAVGNAGLDVGKAVANIPVSVLTAIPDFTKDPDVFLAGGREQALASLLSRDYRKQQKEQMDAARTWDKMTKTKEAVDWVQGLFGGLATDTAQGEQRKLLEAQGFDPAMLQQLANAAKAERHAARRGAGAAGMAPEIANIADINAAQQAGQTRFASDRQLKEIGAQGAETRRNQGNQFGLSKELLGLKRQNRMDEIAYQGDTSAALKKYDAQLGDWRDKKQTLDTASLKKYQTQLDLYKQQQDKGETPNPYPILNGLYDEGIFKANPQLEAVIGYHLSNPTDPKGASDLLGNIQRGLTTPTRQMPAVGGVEGKTVSERNGIRDLAALRRQLRKGQVPEYLRESAKSALQAKSGRLAYDVLMRTSTSLTPKDTDWSAAATRYINSPNFQKLQPDRQTALAEAVATRDKTYLNFVMPKLEAGDMGMADAIMSNKSFIEANDRSKKAATTISEIRNVERMAMTPTGEGIDPSLFSPLMAATLPRDADWLSVALNLGFNEEFGTRKQALISTADKTVSQYILDMTGKVSNVNELNRMRNVAPTGNEASARQFQAKLNAFNAAVKREAETAAREAEAIGESIETGNWRGMLPKGLEYGLRSERDESIRQLNADLAAIESDPDLQPDVPLTPQEQAELERYNANR